MSTGAAALKSVLAPYSQPRLGRSLLDLATSVIPYIALTVAMYLVLEASYLLTIALGVLASGFLTRTYMVFHDCAHGSFLPSKRANLWVGRITGLLIFRGFARWQLEHAAHHGTVGHLDRRGVGDFYTRTVTEYRSMSRWQRLQYRILRHPAFLFSIVPFYGFLLRPRVWTRGAPRRVRRSVMSTNIVLAVLLGALVWLIGWQQLALILLPIVWVAGAIATWLFYVQHQFEDTYWESGDDWNYGEAALHGSSYLKLPKVLQFFTANIGFHHVHHVSSRIPNYDLQRAHDENPIFHQAPTLSLFEGVRGFRLKLWDETTGALVPFSALRSDSPHSPLLPAGHKPRA